MKLARKARTKEQREADMNTLARLYVKGTSQMEISKRIGISQAQVSIDLKKLLKQWQDTRLNEIDRYKHEQLLRVNMIEEEMWAAWEKSKTKGKKTTTKGKAGKLIEKKDPLTGMKSKVEGDEEYWRVGEQEEEPIGGDMQYMNGIQWCMQERAKILGLYAPKKVANTDPTGEKEAGISAKEELMGMLTGIVKRMNPETEEEKNYVEGVLVNELDKDHSIQDVDEESLPPLARMLNRERVKRLPAADEDVEYDETGAIITEAREVEETKGMIADLQAKLGE